MSLACYKQYSVTVNIPIPATAYWNLDEAAGSVPRNDSIGLAHLVPLGITAPGGPGLISLGVNFTAVFGGQDYINAVPYASLGHTAGHGFTVFGWFKLDVPDLAFGGGGPWAAWNFGGRYIRIAVGESTDPQPVKIDTNDDTVYVATTLGDWHFFALMYDPALQQHVYSIDNGPQATLPTLHAYGTIANGTFELVQNWAGWDGGDMTFDEIGICPDDRLTLAQLAFLYNGGAGRTYPF